MLNLKSHVEEMGAPSHAQSRGGTVRRRPEVGMAVSNGAAQSFGLQLWHLAGAENRPALSILGQFSNLLLLFESQVLAIRLVH